MKPSTFFPLLVVLLLHSIQTFSSAASTMETVCNLVGDFYVTPQFCVETLGADPDSRTADLPGLGMIAVNMTVNNATAVTSKIESLLQIEFSNDTRRSLETCRGLYSDMIASLKYATDAIRAKQYDAAKSLVDASEGVATSCDAQPEVPSVLKSDNEKFVRLAILAEAIVSRLSGN
ncbi:putative invertase inhibitor [Typha angustifolia]|uniref:putative invertase inhibitor n=1 Tax=Typha angustifolia TaxID=59011 RepID=UPI003C2E520A